ncbi:adenosylcobinamide-GDP ribazoletransferase [Eubacterium aggregans]|uniref:adenosylcobinamide-GDP ribazoletransferase n=1 Tax=Eubacterium aggregans TaxID=81409 RepID=UPI003F344556
MRKLLIAISFFTRIKINVADVTEDEFYQSMIVMPIVGLLIGLWLYLVAWLTGFLHVPAIGGVILILAYLFISGGLHLDGVADTTDGLMSARDRAQVMEIMKDSRLGSFGAIALIILFLGSFAAYQTILPLYPVAIVLAQVVGRFCGIQNCYFSTYAEGGGGLGKRIVEITRFWHVALYFILIMGLGYVFIGWVAGVATLGAIVMAAYLCHLFKKSIGGMTGDTIGMTIELCQLTYLLVAAVVAVNWPALCVGVVG